MNTKDLLIQIALIYCLSALVASAIDPQISVTSDVIPYNFWSLDSEQSPSKGTVTITLTGSGDPVAVPVEAILAIDSSESMNKTDEDDKRLFAAESFVNQMNPSKDRVGLVSWDNDIDVSISPTSDFEEVINGIRKVDHDGGTDLNKGLNAAIDLMGDSDDAFKTIVFLSDGHSNNYTWSGVSGSPADRAKDMGIVVYTIGLKLAGEPKDKLEDIARATGGEYYNAPDSDSLTRRYEDISKAISSIAGRGVVVRYAVPENAIIDNYRIEPSDDRMENSAKVLTWNAGTMSIGETWTTSFDVSFKNGGIYTLGAAPESKVDYAKFDGTSANDAIPESKIEVFTPGTFSLTGMGINDSREHPTTRVKVFKNFTPNAQGTCPDINLTVQMPPNPFYIDAVFALDTSPSMVYVSSEKDPSRDLKTEMKDAIETLINQDEFKVVNVSIVSWDEGTPDFVTELQPVGDRRWIDNALRNLSEDETEHTVYEAGLEPAIKVFDDYPTIDPYITRRIIVFVTGKSEFIPGDWQDLIPHAIEERYIVYTVGLKIDKDKTPMQHDNLTRMAEETGGKFYQIDDISEIATKVDDITRELSNLPVADDITVTDTLYPYLVVGDSDITVTNGTSLSISHNADGSATIFWILGEMKGGQKETLIIHPSLMISLPADINESSRYEEIYGIDETTPSSEIKYTWQVGPEKGSDIMTPIPKGEIQITCGMPSEKTSALADLPVEPEPAPMDAEAPATEESSKTPGFESIISIGGILAAIYAFRRR